MPPVTGGMAHTRLSINPQATAPIICWVRELDDHGEFAVRDLVCAIVGVCAVELSEAVFEVLERFQITIEIELESALVHVVEQTADARIKPIGFLVPLEPSHLAVARKSVGQTTPADHRCWRRKLSITDALDFVALVRIEGREMKPVVDVHQHFQRLRAAQMRFFGVFEQEMLCIFIWPAEREQYEDLRLPPEGWGALSLEPHLRLYFARPLAVRPAPFEAGFFSPRPTDRLTLHRFLAMASLLLLGETFVPQVCEIEAEEVVQSEQDQTVSCLHA